MTLLSAISTLREDLPVIVITRDDEKHVEALAYAMVPRPVFQAGRDDATLSTRFAN